MAESMEGHSDGPEEGQLRDEKAHHRGEQNEKQVSGRDFFLGPEKRTGPEQGAGANGPEGEKHYGADRMGGGYVLAEDDIEAEDNVCSGGCQMPGQFVLVHFLTLL